MAFEFSRIRNFARSNAGSTAVEFAIAAPIMLALMFAIIEFGRAWWTKNTLQYAVERAVRYAVICSGNNCPPSDTQIKAYAVGQVNGQTIDSSSFAVSHPDPGTTCVNYTYNYAPWFTGELGVMSGSMAITGTSCRAHS